MAMSKPNINYLLLKNMLTPIEHLYHVLLWVDVKAVYAKFMFSDIKNILNDIKKYVKLVMTSKYMLINIKSRGCDQIMRVGFTLLDLFPDITDRITSSI